MVKDECGGTGVGILGSCPGRSERSESLDSWLALGEVPMEERVQAGLTMESSRAPWLTESARALGQWRASTGVSSWGEEGVRLCPRSPEAPDELLRFQSCRG